jgi:hypothetical protein
MHTKVHRPIDICTHAYTHIRPHITHTKCISHSYVYIYIYIHTYIHTYIHAEAIGAWPSVPAHSDPSSTASSHEPHNDVIVDKATPNAETQTPDQDSDSDSEPYMHALAKQLAQSRNEGTDGVYSNGRRSLTDLQGHIVLGFLLGYPPEDLRGMYSLVSCPSGMLRALFTYLGTWMCS